MHYTIEYSNWYSTVQYSTVLTVFSIQYTLSSKLMNSIQYSISIVGLLYSAVYSTVYSMHYTVQSTHLATQYSKEYSTVLIDQGCSTVHYNIVQCTVQYCTVYCTRDSIDLLTLLYCTLCC